VFAVCVGKPGSGAGREIKNLPKKTMGCLVMDLKKTEKVPHQVFHRPSVPVGFLLLFVRQTKSREERFNKE
jgi:hypothetical protein